MSESKADQLATRLERGWKMIESAEGEARKAKLTEQWIRMLGQYEEAYKLENQNGT